MRKYGRNLISVVLITMLIVSLCVGAVYGSELTGPGAVANGTEIMSEAAPDDDTACDTDSDDNAGEADSDEKAQVPSDSNDAEVLPDESDDEGEGTGDAEIASGDAADDDTACNTDLNDAAYNEETDDDFYETDSAAEPQMISAADDVAVISDVSDGNISVTLEGGEDNAKSNYTSLQNAFSQASEGSTITVKIAEKGTYYVSSGSDAALKIRSNTTWDLNGSTIIRAGSMQNLIQNADTSGSQTTGGYTLSENITIKNGTLDGSGGDSGSHNVVNFGHATNVIFSNLTVQNCRGAHLIELSGCSDSQITDCIFTGYTKRTDDTYDGAEAIQLDISSKDASQSWNQTFTLDGTVCKDITVSGCTFKDYPAGVGNHHSLTSGGNTGIKIKNNTFSNTSDWGDSTASAIWCHSFTDSEISGNTITGKYLYGIEVSAGNVTVKNNTIGSSSSYFSGGHGILVHYANQYNSSSKSTSKKVTTGGTLSGNKIYVTGSDNVGIAVYNGCVLDKISSNTIISKKYYALHVSGSGSSVTTVSSNKLTANANIALVVSSSGSISSAYSNTITSKGSSSKGRAVQVSSKGTITTFGKKDKGNTVTASGDYAVLVTASGSKIKNLNYNTIKASKGNGIEIATKGKATYIKNNTVTATKKDGIYVTSSGAAVTTISGNKVTAKKGSGIYITTKAKVTTISSNTITSPKKYGIGVLSSAKVTTIKSNKISKAGSHGIYVSSATAKNIQSNTIKSCKGAGIYIASKGKAEGKINSNKISSCSKSGIYVTSKGYVKKVQSNTLKSNKKYGIEILSTKNKVTVTKNTFSKNKSGKLKVKAKGTVQKK